MLVLLKLFLLYPNILLLVFINISQVHAGPREFAFSWDDDATDASNVPITAPQLSAEDRKQCAYLLTPQSTDSKAQQKQWAQMADSLSTFSLSSSSSSSRPPSKKEEQKQRSKKRVRNNGSLGQYTLLELGLSGLASDFDISWSPDLCNISPEKKKKLEENKLTISESLDFIDCYDQRLAYAKYKGTFDKIQVEGFVVGVGDTAITPDNYEKVENIIVEDLSRCATQNKCNVHVVFSSRPVEVSSEPVAPVKIRKSEGADIIGGPKNANKSQSYFHVGTKDKYYHKVWANSVEIFTAPGENNKSQPVYGVFNQDKVESMVSESPIVIFHNKPLASARFDRGPKGILLTVKKGRLRRPDTKDHKEPNRVHVIRDCDHYVAAGAYVHWIGPPGADVKTQERGIAIYDHHPSKISWLFFEYYKRKYLGRGGVQILLSHAPRIFEQEHQNLISEKRKFYDKKLRRELQKAHDFLKEKKTASRVDGSQKFINAIDISGV